MSVSKDNGSIVIKAFKKLRPEAKQVRYDYETKEIKANGVSTYPTAEELQLSIDGTISEIIANEGRIENMDPYSLVYKNMWDGDYAGTSEWQELKSVEVGSGIYMVQLDAHTRFNGKSDYHDPDPGQFGCFIDGVDIIGGLPEDSTLSGGCWTNIADLSETADGHKHKSGAGGGERNNGNQILLLSIPSTTNMRFKGRTPDPDKGGIKMRMRTTVYKLGEV